MVEHPALTERERGRTLGEADGIRFPDDDLDALHQAQPVKVLPRPPVTDLGEHLRRDQVARGEAAEREEGQERGGVEDEVLDGRLRVSLRRSERRGRRSGLGGDGRL